MSDGFITTLTTAGRARAGDNPATWPSGDASFRVDFALDDYTAGSERVFYAKTTGSDSDRSFRWQLGGDNKLYLLVFPDGTFANRVTYAAGVGVGEANGTRVHLRVDLDVDDGGGGSVGTFYKRTDTSKSLDDDTGWSQIGQDSGNASIAGMPDTASDHDFGDTRAGGGPLGDLYQCMLMDGIGGTVVAHWDSRDDANQTTGGDASEWDDQVGAFTWSINGTEDTDWSYTEPTSSTEFIHLNARQRFAYTRF